MDVSRRFADKELERLERRLSREYAQAEKELRKKRADFMKEYNKELKSKKALLEKGELSKEKYKQWLSEQALYESWVNEMVDYMASEQVNVNKRAAEMINDAMPTVYAESFNFGTFMVEESSGINTAFNLYNVDAVKKLVVENPKLLPEANIDIPKDKRWNYQKMKTALVQGVLQGEGVAKMAKRLQRVTDMNHTTAVRNARTMFIGAENGGRLDSFTRAVDMGIGLKKMWRATLDSRTRDSHAILDGEIVELDEAFSNGLMYPGDPDGSAGEVYNCRCRLSMQLNGFERNQNRIVNGEEFTEEQYQKWKAERLAKAIPLKDDVTDIINLVNGTYDRAFKNAKVYQSKSIDEYKKYIKGKYGIDYNSTLDNLNFELVKDGFSGVEAVLDDIIKINPKAINLIKIINEEANEGMMATTPVNGVLSLSFNKRFYVDRDVLISEISSGITNTFLRGTNPSTLGAHEAGHIVEWILDQNIGKDARYVGISPEYGWSRCYIAYDIVAEAERSVASELAKKRIAGVPWAELGKLEQEFNSISNYARKDYSEQMAEAFHDVYGIRKENASYLNKEIVRISLERIRNMK